jgi:hypothetical protein
MRRRTAIKIVALSALAPKLGAMGHGLCDSSAGTAWSAINYKLRFFTPEENELLDQLMEMIIPADDHSPGAHAAQVSLFADLMVSTSSAATQKQWRGGLKKMQEEARRSSLTEALAKSAGHEGHATSNLERFFGILKQMTVNGYYTSAIGIHQDLRYQGNSYLTAFPGCGLQEFPTSPAGNQGEKTPEARQARVLRDLSHEHGERIDQSRRDLGT